MDSHTKFLKITLFLISLVVLSSCASSTANMEKETITVSAAASLTLFLDDIIEQFEQEHEQIDVLVNYGSSGSLQRQIEQGAPIDVFLSAGTVQIDRLDSKGLLLNNTIKPLLTNTLVIIEPKAGTDNVETFHSLEELFNSKQPTYIALGELDTVPAGIYAKQALEHEATLAKWQNRFVYGKDVREVLAYVEQGNADLGIVYASDAFSSDKVNVLYTVPAHMHDPILYMGAVVEASEQKDAAQTFLSYLNDLRWKETYERYGFVKVD